MRPNTPPLDSLTFPLSLWTTEIITAIFSDIDLHPQDFFLLTGSTVHAILTNKAPQSLDIDIVTTASERLLKNQGFIQNINKPQLFTKSITLNNSKFYIEIFRVVSHKRSLEEFIQEDQKRRDFTICKLYAYYDKQHKSIYVIDPTHQGILHLHEKILHISEHPLQTLNDDPMRLLRAIKYILREYTPSVVLREALEAWKCPTMLNGETLLRINIAIKKLFAIYPEKLSDLFEEYAFLKKLFRHHGDYISVISSEELSQTLKPNDIICEKKDGISAAIINEDMLCSKLITPHLEIICNEKTILQNKKFAPRTSELRGNLTVTQKKKKSKAHKPEAITNPSPEKDLLPKIIKPTKISVIHKKQPIPESKTIDSKQVILLINAFIALHSKKSEEKMSQPETLIHCKIFQEEQLYKTRQHNSYIIHYLYTVFGLLGTIHCTRQVLQNSYSLFTPLLALASCFFLKKGIEEQMTITLHTLGFFENKSTEKRVATTTPQIADL